MENIKVVLEDIIASIYSIVETLDMPEIKKIESRQKLIKIRRKIETLQSEDK